MTTTVALLIGTPISGDAVSTTPHPSGPMCDNGWSGLASFNPVESLRAGVYGVPGRPPTKVSDDGKGDVDWDADPYDDLTWQVWLTSLKWLGPLVDSYHADGNRADLDLALAYARDYVQDKPLTAATEDTPILQSTGHRLMFFTCLYEAAPSPWLADAMTSTMAFLTAHWAGAFNHGQDQDVSQIAAACVLGLQDQVQVATTRLAQLLAVSIDSEGATNEQSTGYAYYSYRRWLGTASALATCGEPPLPGLSAKLELARRFIAAATRPDGTLVPIGDTSLREPGITGLTGLPLSNVWNTGGYAFGRSSWSASDDPSHYSLRFGPGRAVHGGADHGSVTLYAHGAPILTEPGSIGYTDPRTPWFRYAPEAHNVLLVSDGRCATSKRANLIAQKRRSTYDTYVVKSPSCNGTSATRGLAYTRATGTTVVTDATTVAPRALSYQQLWHLTPGTVVTSGWTDRHTVLRISLRMPNGSRATFHVTSPSHTAFAFSAVTGRTAPYQGWVSGGVRNPIPAPVLVISQRSRAASLRTTIDTR